MKKITMSILGMLFLVCMVFSSTAQNASLVKQKAVTRGKEGGNLKTMTWTTKSEAARKLASEGTGYFMNIEFSQAYEKFAAALKLDPDFTVALVFMVNLTSGETKNDYRKKAMNSVANKTEGEKLFATLADEKNSQAQNRETWAKLHTMFPDGSMIGHFYALTRETPEEKFTAAADYIKQFPDKAAMHNMMGYYYMLDKKDMESAKKSFEKYIALYPTGCNPYDSMAEFYLTNGDKENAKKYYTIALEKYPFNISSVNALEKMKEEKKTEKPE